MKNGKEKTLKQRLETAWDVPPLPQGSRERFLDRLGRAERPQRHRRKFLTGAFAATAAAVAAVVWLLTPPREGHEAEPTPMALTIAEIKGYYKGQMWSEAEFIIGLSRDLDEKTRESLLQEVKAIQDGPDSLVESLQHEAMPEDQKIHYIAQIYRSHLRSMQKIRSLLDERVAIKK